MHADTHRSTDSTRSQQVSWSDVAAVDCVMGKLLLHGPVHVLEMEREIEIEKKNKISECNTSYWFTISIKEAAAQTCFCSVVMALAREE